MGKCENAKIIKLRKLEPSDLPFLYQWENDASVWADGANHNPLSQQDLRDYIESTTGDIYKDGQLRLIIEDLSTLNFQPSTLGCIDLFDFDPRNRRAAIGMYIAPEYRGQGIGREAVRLLEEYAFGFLHLRIIYAIISILLIGLGVFNIVIKEDLCFSCSLLCKGSTNIESIF